MRRTITLLLALWMVMMIVMPREADAHRRYYRGGYHYYAPRYGFSFYYQRPSYGHYYHRPYQHYRGYDGYDYPRYDRFYYNDRRYCY